jgi:hypothetical protein
VEADAELGSKPHTRVRRFLQDRGRPGQLEPDPEPEELPERFSDKLKPFGAVAAHLERQDASPLALVKLGAAGIRMRGSDQDATSDGDSI